MEKLDKLKTYFISIVLTVQRYILLTIKQMKFIVRKIIFFVQYV